jgi:hypothetical protein
MKLWIIILFFVIGCATTNHQYPIEARYELYKYYSGFRKDKDLFKIINLRDVRIIICGDTSYYKHPMAELIKSSGYATYNPDTIWTLGWRTKNDKIIIDSFNLGHELQHILNHYNMEIVNPDIKPSFKKK